MKTDKTEKSFIIEDKTCLNCSATKFKYLKYEFSKIYNILHVINLN